MTDHELKTWLEDAIRSTDSFCFLCGEDVELDDTFGWGGRFSEMHRRDSLTPYGLLLTGPDGCGKHTAAAHMFRILSQTHNALLLNGRELCADGYAAATHRLRYTLDHCGTDDDGNIYPWCLILEGLEDCGFRRELFSWLGQALSFEWLTQTENPPPFLILIDSIVEDIPSALRRYLRLCRMALPTAARRNEFFSTIIPAAKGFTFNLKLLVDSTDGLTYAQMTDLAQNLKCTLYTLGWQISDDALLDFLQEQMPDPAAEDPLRSLAESARMFIESLPELMTHMGTAVVSAPIQQVVSQPILPDTSIDQHMDPIEQEAREKAAKEKEYTEMPVSQLATELFGEERLNRILATQPA